MQYDVVSRLPKPRWACSANHRQVVRKIRTRPKPKLLPNDVRFNKLGVYTTRVAELETALSIAPQYCAKAYAHARNAAHLYVI